MWNTALTSVLHAVFIVCCCIGIDRDCETGKIIWSSTIVSERNVLETPLPERSLRLKLRDNVYLHYGTSNINADKAIHHSNGHAQGKRPQTRPFHACMNIFGIELAANRRVCVRLVLALICKRWCSSAATHILEWGNTRFN
jgi:hypothetical protein